MKKILNSLIISTLFTGILFLAACKKEAQVGGTASSSPLASAITPAAAASNAVLTLTGSGLGDIQSIMFDSGKVNAVFNPVFNTDNTIIFRVPVEAIPAKQNIILTNSLGKQVVVPFQVLGLPTITDVSNYDWSTQYPQITLTGKNLDDVFHVAFAAGTDTATIVSKTKSSLVLKMPVTATFRSMLNISNMAGTVTTTQEFVNIDNAYQIFAKNNFQNGWYDNSWTKASPNISTAVSKTGTSSFVITYPAGAWQVEGFATGGGPVYSADYTFLSFWIKGGTVDHTINIESDQAKGWGQNSINPIVVPAAVWTYFKIPLNTLGLATWTSGKTLTSIGFFLKGQTGDVNETYYLDDVMLVK